MDTHEMDKLLAPLFAKLRNFQGSVKELANLTNPYLKKIVALFTKQLEKTPPEDKNERATQIRGFAERLILKVNAKLLSNAHAPYFVCLATTPQQKNVLGVMKRKGINFLCIPIIEIDVRGNGIMTLCVPKD